jgi:hypothetical protein
MVFLVAGFVPRLSCCNCLWGDGLLGHRVTVGDNYCQDVIARQNAIKANAKTLAAIAATCSSMCPYVGKLYRAIAIGRLLRCVGSRVMGRPL